MQHPGDGIAKLSAVNWAVSLGHCGFNSVSYNTTPLICKRLEQDGRVAGNSQWNNNCPGLTLTGGLFSGSGVWESAGGQVLDEIHDNQHIITTLQY